MAKGNPMMMMSNPVKFAQSAVSVVLGADHPVRRDPGEMMIQELETAIQSNKERLRLARQTAWIGGFGSGFLGALSVVKKLK
jgi:predicted esterase